MVAWIQHGALPLREGEPGHLNEDHPGRAGKGAVLRIWTLKIVLENDAFQAAGDFNPEEAAAVEVGRILDQLSEHINATADLPRQSIRDANGNSCGVAYIARKSSGPWDPKGGA
jgi:hypothetical protein